MTAAQINRNKVQEKTSDITMIDNTKREKKKEIILYTFYYESSKINRKKSEITRLN